MLKVYLQLYSVYEYLYVVFLIILSIPSISICKDVFSIDRNDSVNLKQKKKKKKAVQTEELLHLSKSNKAINPLHAFKLNWRARVIEHEVWERASVCKEMKTGCSSAGLALACQQACWNHARRSPVLSALGIEAEQGALCRIPCLSAAPFYILPAAVPPRGVFVVCLMD